MANSVALYLNDIGKVPLLTADDEKRLATTIETGRFAEEKFHQSFGVEYEHAPSYPVLIKDVYVEQLPEEPSFPQLLGYVAQLESRKVYNETQIARLQAELAKDVFVRSNLRLVVSIAKRYPIPEGMEFLDLIQEGNLGLEHAVDKFDHERGFKFSTYATWWIRQAISRALETKSTTIKTPANVGSRIRTEKKHSSLTGKPISDEVAGIERLVNTASLDKTVGVDGDISLGDLISSPEPSPEEQVVALFDRDLIEQLMKALDERARYAVGARFGLIDGECKKFRQVAAELDVTPEAARRLVSRAISTMRKESQKN
jgi:RNA polymerase primary sigma factor